jgi:hypothetical protein
VEWWGWTVGDVASNGGNRGVKTRETEDMGKRKLNTHIEKSPLLECISSSK